MRLFASVLRREPQGYVLATPAERGRIEVADVPFLGVELTRQGEGRAQSLEIRTNVEDRVRIDAAHPLRVATAANGEPRPYVLVRDGLEARLLRPVFYELVDLACEEQIGGSTAYGVWSAGQFFPLGEVP